MPGFTAIISNDTNIVSNARFRDRNIYAHEKNFNSKFIVHDSYLIEHFTNKKFSQDKILQEDDKYILGIEGVILNLKELKEKHDKHSVFEIITSLFDKAGENFIKQLKGDFSGFIYSKTANKWYIFTNPVGSKKIFYFQNDRFFIFSSELKEISTLLGRLNIGKNMDTISAYALLTYGFMLEDRTLIENVKSVRPGNVLILENDKINLYEYFHLRNITPSNETKDEIIEQIDLLFNRAIKLGFDKDKEYGYKHIATLSGGLDSRMTVLSAHKLGYTEQLNFCFSHSDYLDEKISKKIASDYRHEFLFQSLDNGNYLKNIDEVVACNDGLVIYSGSAHVAQNIKNINFEQYGLIHTGMVGDAVIGSFLSQPYAVKPQARLGAYSTKLFDKISCYANSVAKLYDTEELFLFYGRAFLGALNGYHYFDIFSQATSPFLDTDFLSYCYSIPENMKFKQKIYIEWVAKKHAEFGDYPWEKTGVSPLKSLNYKRFMDAGYYRRMSLKFFDRLSGSMKSGMNPYDYWIEKNVSLKNAVIAYFNDHIGLLDSRQELKQDCWRLFHKGNTGEKFQVLTLLSALKLHEIQV